MKFYTFKAAGGGEFPVDMLRYDRCYPRASEDAGRLCLGNLDRKEKRTVELVSDQTPTAARWSSFGWTVSDVQLKKY